MLAGWLVAEIDAKPTRAGCETARVQIKPKFAPTQIHIEPLERAPSKTGYARLVAIIVGSWCVASWLIIEPTWPIK